MSNEFPDAPDRYELAARMKFEQEKSWQEIRRELSLTENMLAKLRREIRYDFRTALLHMMIDKKRQSKRAKYVHKKRP